MHLTITNTLRGIFSFGGSEKKGEATDHSYEYIRGPITQRGPCPGLNALANQGYLPRDGSKITLAAVENALKTALHMSGPLASSLSKSLKPIVKKDGTFDLVDMRAHGVLEHDRSITRLDTNAPSNPTHDNFTFQPDMFEAFLKDAGTGEEPVTIKSLAKTYVRRKKESQAQGQGKLGVGLWFVNLLQTVSLLNTAGGKDGLDRGVVRVFYEEERFPDVVVEDERTRTLFGLVGKAIVLLFHVVF